MPRNAHASSTSPKNGALLLSRERILRGVGSQVSVLDDESLADDMEDLLGEACGLLVGKYS